MSKVIVIQSPAKFYEAVPFFHKEAEKFGFLDKFYIVTDFEGDFQLGKNCKVIQLKKDKQFSSNMLDALSQIEEDVFFVCCEDHVLKGENDARLWQICFDFASMKPDVGFLRMTNNNRVELENSDFISPIKKKDKYYISLQPGIWKKSYFKHALKPGEDAWKFEINGAKRARESKDLRSYCVKETVFRHTNFFKGGKFYRHKFAEYAILNGFKLSSGRKIHWKGGQYTFDEYKDIYLKRITQG